MPRLVMFVRPLILAFLTLSAATAQAEWHQASTANFTIYAEMSEAELRREALKLEGFDRLLRLRFGITDAQKQYPLTIYLLPKSSEVDILAGRTRASGFYRTGRFGSFAVAGMDERQSAGRQSREDILLHEYTHHFFFRHVQAPRPAWFVEGFAQYFATAQLSDRGEWTIGRVAGNRSAALLKGDRLPIRTVLSAAPMSLAQGETGMFYAQSWLLVHMLYASPARQAQLQAYLAGLGRGTDSLTAASSAFGDLDALGRALNVYLKSSLQAVTYDPIGDYSGPLAITRLDAADAALVRPTLRRRSGSELSATRADLEALAARHPQHAPTWFELALVRLDLSNRAPSEQTQVLQAEAEAALDRALAVNPKHGRANLLKAELRMRALSRAKDTDASKWRDVRGFIYNANQADPDDPAPLFTWFETYARQGKPPSDTARAGLARAFSLQPEVPDLRAQYAFDLARNGDYARAEALIAVLSGDPHNAARAADLLGKLRALKEGRQPES